VPFLCCLGPRQAFRIAYGNYPIGSYRNGKIKEGMTADEVLAILGTPHERSVQADGENWIYWIDSFTLDWYSVSFGPDGRVERTHPVSRTP
jgi:outer membrane protein assembly factor BamE (lipoprotein component of BamABCDE complex)